MSGYGETVEITYEGGWTAETVPPKLERAIARAAAGLLTNPTGRSLIPGTVEARNGDLALRLEAPATLLDTFAPGVTSMINGYKDRGE